MNIKDYLHLYIPFEAAIAPIVEGERLTKAEINCVDIWKERCFDSDGFDWAIKNIRPILRPLGDISKEEVVELLCVEGTILNGNYCRPFFQCSYIDNLGEHSCIHQYDTQLQPNQFLFLLSKHFDLFGLIEAGIALDATKL